MVIWAGFVIIPYCNEIPIYWTRSNTAPNTEWRVLWIEICGDLFWMNKFGTWRFCARVKTKVSSSYWNILVIYICVCVRINSACNNIVLLINISNIYKHFITMIFSLISTEVTVPHKNSRSSIILRHLIALVPFASYPHTAVCGPYKMISSCIGDWNDKPYTWHLGWYI